MSSYLIGGRLIAGDGLDAGEITVRAIPASGWSVDMPLNDGGSIDLDLSMPMVDPVTGVAVDLAAILVPGRDFIGVVENDDILEAGPIWADPFTWPKSAQVVCNGLWSYFDHRFVLPVLDPGILPRNVTSKWENLHTRTIAKRLVQQACSHPNSDLPIDYEPDIAGTDSREYAGGDLIYVGSALRDLTEVEGGPEITFRPTWGVDRRHVRWALLTGNPELTQSAEPHYWDTSVPDAHAKIISIDRDGSDIASRAFLTGKTIRNLARDGEFRDGVGQWVTGGANGTLTAMVAGAVERAMGVKGYSLSTWTGNSGAGNGGVWSQDVITVEEGLRYFVSVAAQGTSKSVRLMAQFRSDTGVIGSTQIDTGITGSGYAELSGVVTAPPDAVKMGVFLYPIAGQQWVAGNTLRTTQWVVHEDTGDALPYFYDEIQVQSRADDASLLTAGFPLLESKENKSTVASQPLLRAHANETVARKSAHVETWTIAVRRDKFPLLGSYMPGDYARIRVGENPRIPAGTYTVRIIGLQFGRTGDVTLLCAPERVVSGYPVPPTKRNWLRDKLRALRAAIDEANRG